uniref:PCI domain-containing protein n=1 Tax=Euplotes harpa TaxID=151035 RepID=A0A7S3JBB9_9SPIT|mmetsp:Transcript_26852/g.30998  ORF Transcript_26852/g.30998 Transcript_26852/m.30998 type:complete len:295 (+) Transcript_26852:475-1359(+)
MWMEIQIKLGKLYLEKGDFGKLDQLIAELKKGCTEGGSSEHDNSYLLEIYSLEIQLCVETNNSKRLRAIYPETEKLSTVLNDPRVTGVIKEHGGKMFMKEKQWKRACDELFEAFKCYQEVANPEAKVILKYVILASIISNSEINYADTREAKVYQEDKEISALMNLRVAYENNDYQEILAILNKVKKDDFMVRCLDDFMRNIRLNALIIKIRPYKNVELKYLAKELEISEKEVKTLLVELILDQRIDGKIDQKQGYLELSSAKKDVISKKKHQAISSWLDSLADLNGKIIQNKY